MVKRNQIISGGDKDFRFFEKEKGGDLESFIAVSMDIESPSFDSWDEQIEALEKLVKWTRNITRKANKQIKEIKEHNKYLYMG